MNPRKRKDEPAPARGVDAVRPHVSGADPGRAAAGRTVMKVARGVLADGMAHRPVDVICAGMYRACSTWQYEVVAHLVEHHRGGRRVGYLTPDQYIHPDEPNAGGWRVFKSHDGHPCFADAIVRGEAVAIYAYRDVRDVVFSLMHKRRWTFEETLRRGMIHQVLANDRFWTARPNVLIQRYEEILADPTGSVRGLAHHLGIRLAAGEAERIADEYSLAANKARTEALRQQLEQEGVDLNQSESAWICDSNTLLHWNHVRDGRAGSWFAESTARHRVILRRLCGPWLKAHGYPPAPDDADRPASTLPERIRLEMEILRGWLSFRSHNASMRHPRLTAIVRRCLRLGRKAPVAATVWSESKPDRASRDH